MNKKKIFKNDVLLIAILLLLSIIAFVVIHFFIKKPGNYVIIKCDGKTIEKLSLDVEQEITVSGFNGGVNKVVIKNNKVSMMEADCPDKLCINMGTISNVGETIVCLPHRIVVEIVGDEQELDGYAR